MRGGQARLLRLRRETVEEEAHHRRCCSLAVVVHERVAFGLRVERLM